MEERKRNSSLKQYQLQDVLSDKQVRTIIRKTLNDEEEWHLVRSEVRPASDHGLLGFSGDHIRVTLHVVVGETTESINLFVKRLPFDNPLKLEFIKENNFFTREAMMGKLMEELQEPNDHQEWCIKPLISTDSMIVMPYLRHLGYSVRTPLESLDLPHLLAAVTAVAKFHAATTNYETRKTLKSSKPWTLSQHYAEILTEPTFDDQERLQTCAKLTTNILKVFSKKYNAVQDLAQKLAQLFSQAVNSLKKWDDTLNVLLHKDLWTNNVMFRYEEGEPVNALLIDYQCLRCGPPAFDLMMLLYCTSSRSFREQHEATVFHHYYSVFSKHLEDASKEKLSKLKYDEKDLIKWCEKARMFGALEAIAQFPSILMDPVTAKQIDDDLDEYKDPDRTQPVVQYCREHPVFRERLLEVYEEFVDRYVDNNKLHKHTTLLNRTGS